MYLMRQQFGALLSSPRLCSMIIILTSRIVQVYTQDGTPSSDDSPLVYLPDYKAQYANLYCVDERERLGEGSARAWATSDGLNLYVYDLCGFADGTEWYGHLHDASCAAGGGGHYTFENNENGPVQKEENQPPRGQYYPSNPLGAEWLFGNDGTYQGVTLTRNTAGCFEFRAVYPGLPNCGDTLALVFHNPNADGTTMACIDLPTFTNSPDECSEPTLRSSPPASAATAPPVPAATPAPAATTAPATPPARRRHRGMLAGTRFN